MMSQQPVNLLVVYLLLVLIGITGAIGDILVYKSVTGKGSAYFVAGCFVWLGCISLFGIFLGLGRYAFSTTLVAVAISHLVVGVVWGLWFEGETLSVLQWLGLILGFVAVILIEVGTDGSDGAGSSIE